MCYTGGMKKRKKGERGMFSAKLRHLLPPAEEAYEPYEQRIKREYHEAASKPPPPGTVRKVESEMNEIIVWPNGDLTLVGADAWKLYESLSHVVFNLSDTNYRHGASIKYDMRDLLRYLEPCRDAAVRVERFLLVEAALRGANLDWPHFAVGIIPIRLAS